MPRSFLVKKHVEIRAYHSYKPRDADVNDVFVTNSVYAVTPYTPAFEQPLSVKISNGYIHDIVSPSIPRDSVHQEIEMARGCEEEGNKEIDTHKIAEEIIRKFQKRYLPSLVTTGYTYDAFFVTDGRARAKHFVTHGGKHRYTCDECGKDYATSSNLSRHKQTHRSLDSQLAKKCHHCGKTYVSMPALSMHLLTHDLKHKCDVCGKSFSRPWLLQGHFRSHTGEKPYGCAHCGKAFADRSNFRAHMQTHSSYKSYNCKRCKKSFALKSYLNKHFESACFNDEDEMTKGESQSSNDSFSQQKKAE